MAKDDQQRASADSAAARQDEKQVKQAAQHAEGLEHSQGGITTRHDATDLGVPMLQGDPAEPVGPEDALGPGPKRGDYSGRIGGSDYQPHEVVRTAEGQIEVHAQRDRASEQGEVPGRKGGVQTGDEGR